jgi:hypothetical protein
MAAVRTRSCNRTYMHEEAERVERQSCRQAELTQEAVTGADGGWSRRHFVVAEIPGAESTCDGYRDAIHGCTELPSRGRMRGWSQYAAGLKHIGGSWCATPCSGPSRLGVQPRLDGHVKYVSAQC